MEKRLFPSIEANEMEEQKIGRAIPEPALSE